ncbi:uncharacterized protein LOC129776627 [Toxorhynchites rutilus septentrionalis]|uniref:uncharacterized protein LOC129776627 n=1 Tax=Toxorhynchites rutilus septentrionalis TaxID=329112 RepID=UPI002479C884|nr:uncharacterized protein LOC129776627 [Toxorhynchites rutilus septentrionalis]
MVKCITVCLPARLQYFYKRFKSFSNHTDCFAHIKCLCSYLAMDGRRNLRWLGVLSTYIPPLTFSIYQTTRGENIVGIGYHFIMIMHSLIALFKMTTLRLNSEKIQTLINYFNAHVFHRDDPQCYHLRRKTYFITWKICFALAAHFILNVAAAFATTGPKSPYIGLCEKQIVWYQEIMLLVIISCIMVHMCIYSTAILIVSFLMHWFQTELEIVATAFSRIIHVKPQGAQGNGVHYLRILFQREEVRWTGIERRMIYCISRHGEIIDLIKLLREIVEPIFFALGFYIVTSISTMIFLMYSDGLYNVLAVGHILAVIFEFYYYAHLVDDLDDKNHLIATVIYKQDWSTQMRYSSRFAKQYKSVKSMILIVIMHSQRPFRFTCGGLYKMTVPVFTALVETIYVAVTFMLRTIKIQRY